MEYCFTFTSASQEFPQCVHGALSVKALIGLVTLTFALLPRNKFTGYPCDVLPSCQFNASFTRAV